MAPVPKYLKNYPLRMLCVVPWVGWFFSGLWHDSVADGIRDKSSKSS